MPLDDVYLVSPHVQTVAEAEIDFLETKLGFALPTGYREYLRKFGTGSFCHSLRVRTPSEILDPENISYWTESLLPAAIENEFWDKGALLTAAELRSSIVFAGDDEGDYYISCPQQPGKLFELPRHESKMHFYKQGFAEPFKFEFCRASGFNLPFFEPPNSRQATVNIKTGKGAKIEDVWAYVAKLGPSPLVVAEGQIGVSERVVAFIPDIVGCAWLDGGSFYFFCVAEHAHVLAEIGRQFGHVTKA
jgi:hypothetical protein